MFATMGGAGLCSFHYVGNTSWLTADQIQQFTAWLDERIRSTTEAIAWIEEQCGLDYRERGMRKRLKRLDDR